MPSYTYILYIKYYGDFMYLKDILDTDLDIEFNNIQTNTLNIQKKDLFIPYGGVTNRLNYLNDAIKKQAAAVITNQDIKTNKIPIVKVNNLDKEIINILNKYYNYPLSNINLIGITGTDGKTTLTSIISDLLNCPSLGTIGYKMNNKIFNTLNTTPSIEMIYYYFNQTKINNYHNLVMEVSSESYLTKRIADLNFDIGVFTNITKEHLDKHIDFNNYLNCKINLFKHSKISILNKDSKYFSKIKKHCLKYYTYGFKFNSTIRILNYKLYSNKTIINFKYLNKKYQVISPLLGKFNVYNLVASILTLIILNYSIDDILNRIKNIKPVLGRMQTVYNNKFQIIIDYAHTINATKEVLKYFYKINKNIITIVGCAGDRYKEKRKVIGKLVLKYSKLVIFTMDDPRYEDVNKIIDEMIDNSKKNNYIKIINRENAIKYAINYAKVNDLILILGKGTDNYMLINDFKIPYSDINIVNKYINFK